MRPVLWICLVIAAPVALSQETDEGAKWPRKFEGEGGVSLTLYQPQVDAWKNYKQLEARVAFELKLPGRMEEVGGAMFTVATETDKEERTVGLSDLKITVLTVPGLEGDARKKAEDTARALFPSVSSSVSLDAVLANLERAPVKPADVKVNNDPPKIIVSEAYAILASIDGEPMLEAVEGTDLQVVINTESVLVRHNPTAKYYVLMDSSWLVAPAMKGPWTATTALPESFKKLPNNANWTEARKHIPGEALAAEDTPKVFGATEPTELIVIEGKPKMAPIPNTKLLYVSNTESDLFLFTDGNYYFLVSGRWFRSTSFQGPWTFCTNNLPGDFSKIPPRHECGRVLVSVPGSDQALEAVIEAHIPETKAVKRSEANLEVTYEGDPMFKQIEGTQVFYATNTSLDVFKVGELFYCCYDAAWFVAKAAMGPWELTDKVPAEIYEIPSTSEKHNVTYVYVQSSTTTVVYYGYRPGYWGVVFWGGLVIWRTAWRHHWRRNYWRHRHRWHRHHPRHRHRHGRAYGHGRHYNHKKGRYDKSHRSRRHHKRPSSGGRPTQGQRKKATRPRGNRGTPAKSNKDLYRGRNGGVYEKKGNSYERRDKGKQTKQPNKSSMNRDSRARSSNRSSQHRSYQKSRGSRTRQSGRSRGGGGRRR